jgi:uncharacterized membrane protein
VTSFFNRTLDGTSLPHRRQFLLRAVLLGIAHVVAGHAAGHAFEQVWPVAEAQAADRVARRRMVWEAYLTGLSLNLSHPRTRAWWNFVSRDLFDHEFVAAVNEYLSRVPVDPDPRDVFERIKNTPH